MLIENVLPTTKKANITVPLILSNKCVQYGEIIVLLAAMP